MKVWRSNSNDLQKQVLSGHATGYQRPVTLSAMLLLTYRGVRFNLNWNHQLVMGRDSSENYYDAGCITGRDLLFDITRPNKLLAIEYHTLSSQGQSGPSVKLTHTPPYNADVRGHGIVWPILVCRHGIAPISVPFLISLIIFQKSINRSSSDGYRSGQKISKSALCNRRACH
jgi:hypothetical protein